MTDLRGGVAQVEYTPELGLPLLGNFRDDYGARGVHDPLYSRALVLQDSTGFKVALLSIDICMLDRNNTALMRRVIAAQTDLLPENVLIAATHTHSAPATMSLGIMPKAAGPTVERFLTQAASGEGYDAQQSRAATQGVEIPAERVNIYQAEIEEFSQAVLRGL